MNDNKAKALMAGEAIAERLQDKGWGMSVEEQVAALDAARSIVVAGTSYAPPRRLFVAHATRDRAAVKMLKYLMRNYPVRPTSFAIEAAFSYGRRG